VITILFPIQVITYKNDVNYFAPIMQICHFHLAGSHDTVLETVYLMYL